MTKEVYALLSISLLACCLPIYSSESKTPNLTLCVFGFKISSDQTGVEIRKIKGGLTGSFENIRSEEDCTLAGSSFKSRSLDSLRKKNRKISLTPEDEEELKKSLPAIEAITNEREKDLEEWLALNSAGLKDNSFPDSFIAPKKNRHSMPAGNPFKALKTILSPRDRGTVLPSIEEN